MILYNLVDTFLALQIETFRIFGIKLINLEDFTELIIRSMFNLLVIFILINKIYKGRGEHKYLFSFYVIGISVFMITFLLNSVKLELGFALGLFAVFGIIRYRTVTIPIKEMTYLFVIIAIAVINALSNKKVSYLELLLSNLIFLTAIYFLEQKFTFHKESKLELIYEVSENEDLSDKIAMTQKLSKLVGMPIDSYTVKELNTSTKIAKITVIKIANT